MVNAECSFDKQNFGGLINLYFLNPSLNGSWKKKKLVENKQSLKKKFAIKLTFYVFFPI